MDPALLALAFTAGMVAFFAPCCIALLPAYVGYTAGADAPPAATHTRAPSVRRRASAGLTLGGTAVLAVGAWPLFQSGLSVVGLVGPVRGSLTSEQDAAALIGLGIAVALGGLLLSGKARQVTRGALMGLAATLGFLTVFLAIGLPIALVARSLAPFVPWLAVAIGLALAGAGALLLAGRSPSLRLPFLRMPRRGGARGFYGFGLGYGLASMSCTFPVFLSVMGIALLAGGLAGSLAVFAAYALGKGVLLVAVTVLAASAGDGFAQRLRSASRYTSVLSGALLLLAGAYVAYYFGRSVLGP